MEIDFIKFYLETGKDLNKLIKYCDKGRIKKITVDMSTARYPLSKKARRILYHLEKNGIIVVWK